MSNFLNLVTKTIKTAMDEKSSAFLLAGIEGNVYAINYDNSRDGFAVLDEVSTGAAVAVVWFPVEGGNPYGDVEVGDRLLEKMGM